MPQRIVTTTHQWVIAACIPVDDRLARRSTNQLSIRANTLPSDLMIEALEAYCSACRRPYDDVADELCEAAESNDHLIGGPTGTRKKRTHMYHDCAALGCPEEVRGKAG